MTQFTYFWSGPLSNWASSPFKYRGYDFKCAEQAMMWEKAMMFDDDISAQKILQSADPATQKMIGRGVVGYNDSVWKKVRFDVVKEILRHKFSQNEKSKAALMRTSGTMLVEASPKDKIWGIGLNEFDARGVCPSVWPGLNLLGKALTEVRTELEKGEIKWQQPKHNWQHLK